VLMRTLLTGAVVIAAMSLAACTGQPSPARVDEPVYDSADGRVLYMDRVPASTRTVVEKDYTIGARRVAASGAPMLTVKNYTVSDRVVGAVALDDFEQRCPGSNDTEVRCKSGGRAYVRGQANERFSVGGAMRQGGNLYYLVSFDAAEQGIIHAASDARGRLKPTDYLFRAPRDAHAVATPLGVPLSPVSIKTPIVRDTALFRFEVDKQVDPLAPNFQHYGLFYEGTTYDHSGMVYHILYREYRRDGSSDPLFQQSLAFAGETSTIDVLGFRIRIHNVSDKQIVYTIQRD